MVPSGVKDLTLIANTDLVESSFGKLEERISRPIEKGIAIREPLPRTHSKMQANAEDHDESINSEYNRKRERKNFC